MSTVVSWKDVPANSKGPSMFMRLEEGQNRVRIVSQPYPCKRPGEFQTEWFCVILDVDDDNAVKVLSLKRAVMDVLKVFAATNGDPAGPEAPGFAILRVGTTKTNTRYSCVSGTKPYSIPAEKAADIAKIEGLLKEFIVKVESGLGGGKQAATGGL